MNIQKKQAYLFCKQKTKAEAKNFYYAFLLLPKQKREAIYVAYAFARECDDIVDEPSENKEEQLQNLRDDLAKTYQNNPPTNSLLFLALEDVVQTFSIPKKYFDELIEGMEMDLHKNRYQSFEELYQYCYKVASVVGLICIHIFRFQDQSCIPYAVDLGIAMQLTNILRDITEDIEIDRIYLPLDELAQYDLSEETLLKGKALDHKKFGNFMEFQIKRIWDYFERSKALLPFLEKDARICPKILGSLYQEILGKIQMDPYSVLRKRTRLSLSKKLFLMLAALVNLQYTNQMKPKKQNTMPRGNKK